MPFSPAELNDSGRRVGGAQEHDGIERRSMNNAGSEVPLALRRFRSEILNRGTALKRRSHRRAH